MRFLGLRGDKWLTAHALLSLAEPVRSRGDYQGAKVMLEEVLALFKEVGDTAYIGWLLYLLGDMARLNADYSRSRALLEESLALSQTVGNKTYMAWAYNSLGRVAQA